MARQDVHEANREFARVVADIDQQARKCLAISVTSRVMQGMNMSTGTTIHSPRMTAPGPGRAEFTLQMRNDPRGIGPAMPPDGFSGLRVDIEQVAPQKTGSPSTATRWAGSGASSLPFKEGACPRCTGRWTALASNAYLLAAGADAAAGLAAAFASALGASLGASFLSAFATLAGLSAGAGAV